MSWWQQFKARHIVADDPYEKAQDLLAQSAPVKRILPCCFRKPNGQWVKGWAVFAQNDAARAELLYCVDCLPPTQVTS